MTWVLPPDSRAITQAPNDPPGVPPEYVEAVCDGVLAAAAVLADTVTAETAGAASSWPGALGILAGLAGTFRTWPGSISLAHLILVWLAQYSTGHASRLWYS